MTYICVGNLTIIGSDNGLSPGRRQAIIWTNAGILSIRTLGTNFSEILIEIYTFSMKKIRLKMLSAKSCPFLLGLNVLIAKAVQSWSKMNEWVTHAAVRGGQGLTHWCQVTHICVSRVHSNRLPQNSLTFPWQYFPDKTSQQHKGIKSPPNSPSVILMHHLFNV